MRHTISSRKAAALIYTVIALMSATYGCAAMLLACYEHNLAAGILGLIPTAAGIALLNCEETVGGE